jgi:hypothetical protein
MFKDINDSEFQFLFSIKFHDPQQCQAFYEKDDEKKVRESVWAMFMIFIKYSTFSELEPSLFRYRVFKYHRNKMRKKKFQEHLVANVH